MSEQLLLATTNSGKAAEMRAFLLSALPSWNILWLSRDKAYAAFQETGSTFLENARGKGLHYSRSWEGLTLGEDSGLEVDCLEGAPGVFSARFAGPHATDSENIHKLLALMREVPWEQRTARFVSCLVLARQGRIIHEFQAKVEGRVRLETKGSGGFGYDPVFFYPPLKKTFAEMEPEEKNGVSHRGQALRQLRDYLTSVTPR